VLIVVWMSRWPRRRLTTCSGTPASSKAVAECAKTSAASGGLAVRADGVYGTGDGHRRLSGRSAPKRVLRRVLQKM
jgi:hypothetical protein